MRPLGLELVAFRSFDEEAVDLRGYGLVTICGDTGSGKTSLLDAISFALFARTAEGCNGREVLTLGADHGEVRLTFRMDGQEWRATRRYGPRAPDPGHLLERLGAAGEPVEAVSGEAAVNARVVDLVGMSFSSFTAAVLLAQGRFSQFLHASPRDRDAILRELFGVASLEGTRASAQARHEAAVREVEVCGRELGILAPHEPGRRNSAARTLRDRAVLSTALAELARLADEAERAHERADALHQEAARAQAIAAALPLARERAALGSRHAALEAALASAGDRRADGERALANAQEAHDGARARHAGTAAELAALRGPAERLAALRATNPREDEDLRVREAELRARRGSLERLQAELDAERHQREALRQLGDAISALADASDRVAAALAAEAEVRGSHDDARRAAEQAEEEAARAERSLDAARYANEAARLRRALRPGDSCPVCGARVTGASAVEAPPLEPAHQRAHELRRSAGERTRTATLLEGQLAARVDERRRAEQAVRGAGERVVARGGDVSAGAVEAQRLRDEVERRREAARAPEERLRADAAALAREEGEVAVIRRRIDGERAQRAELERRIGARLGDDPVACVAAAVEELVRVEGALATAQSVARETAEAAAVAERERDELERGEVAELRHGAALAADRLVQAPPPFDLPVPELLRRVEALEAQAARAGVDAKERAARAVTAAGDLERCIGEAGPALGVRRSSELPVRRRFVEAELHRAREGLAELERVAANGRRLHAEAARAGVEAELFACVATDLRADRFPRYLLQRYRERLASGASVRLQELSGGAYSFAGAEPDPLAVVDHRRGERRRSAATLSGGERFLASLALALALSDVACESGGRLDCLFLDEGFSSLDNESLELAIAGIERLSVDGRLIGVITHLPGVADRLGATIRVGKDPAGVSRVLVPVGG